MTTNPFIREGRTDFSHYEEWETVSFTPLADWVCVYKDAGRTHGYAAEDCPGVLLQESTETTWMWDEENSPGHEESSEHERITRVVFATESDCRNATVVPVDDVLGDNPSAPCREALSTGGWPHSTPRRWSPTLRGTACERHPAKRPGRGYLAHAFFNHFWLAM